MNENKRMALFVDLINIFHNVNTAFSGAKLDYKIYLDKLNEEGIVFRAVAYGASIDDESYNFQKCLKINGFEVKYVQARRFNGKSIIKYTDRTIDIILDIIRMLERLDVVVIGSTNLNLIPFFDFLKEKGIGVIVYACNIPTEIKMHVDQWIEISEDLLEIREDEILVK
jgi:uncharacterized LabA/DUF88 family protein